MAEKNRQILQHLRTSRPIDEVQSQLQNYAEQGEIAIQYDGTIRQQRTSSRYDCNWRCC